MVGTAVLAACSVAALVLRRRPDRIVLAAIMSWLLIPHVVVEHLPMSFSCQPATFLLLFGLVFHAIDNTARDEVRVRSGVTVHLVLLFFLGIAAISQASSGHLSHGSRLALEQILAPLALFVLVRAAVRGDDQFRTRCARLLVLVAAGESLLAIVQRTLANSVPYEHFFLFQDFYNQPGWNRYSGTLDHPLVLGMLLSIAVFHLPILPSFSARFALSGLFLAAADVTQSRVALVLVAVGVGRLVIEAELPASKRVPLLITLAGVAAISWNNPLQSATLGRFTDDQGSAAVRSEAFAAFFAHLHEFILHGGGIAYAGTFTTANGIASSLENPLAIYTVDFGLVAAVAYFGVQFVLVGRALTRPANRTFALAALAACIAVQSFSSIETQTASAVLLWFALGLAAPTQPATDWRPGPTDPAYLPRHSRTA